MAFRSGWKVGWISSIALAVMIGVLGVVMAHHPMIFSGFRRIQTDLGDTRLIHYLLEHGYRWVGRDPRHLDFWSPPFFSPVKNGAAYSDVLVSVGPTYWLWRALGASPDLAFGLWLLSMSALNYAAGLLFFRRGLGFGMPAAVAGASLIAFGAPRLNQMGHQQLLPFFYPLLTLYALARLFGDLSLGWRARADYWLLAIAGVVAQLYAAVYLGWFLIVGLGLAAAVALAMRPGRSALLAVVGRDAWAIAAAGVAGIALLQPFLAHYREAAREVRQSDYIPTLRALHPTVWSWFDVGERNWFWGWTAHPGWAGKQAYLETEHHLGIGVVTPIACMIGLYLGRKWPVCQLAAVLALIVWFATTYMPDNHLAIVGAGISYFCAAGLFHEVDRPGWRAIGLAVVVCPLVLVQFPSPYAIVLGLTTIVFCIVEIGRARGRPLGLIVPGIGLAVASVKLFGPTVLAFGLVPVVPVAGFLAYYRVQWRRDVAFGSLAFLMLFSVMTAYFDRPRLVLGAAAASLISLAATALPRYRRPAWVPLRALLIGLPFLPALYDGDSLWLACSEIIPGGVAIRAVGRVVLILLVPAAMGLACLLEFLERRRLAVASWIVVFICLAEQGMTTDTFDAAANRAAIDGLASQIDRDRVAFYYRPADLEPFYRHHLDAMWASLATAVPTVNGYSGHAPDAWHRFSAADVDPEVDVGSALAAWEQMHGFPANHIQRIGAERLDLPPTEKRDRPR